MNFKVGQYVFKELRIKTVLISSTFNKWTETFRICELCLIKVSTTLLKWIQLPKTWASRQGKKQCCEWRSFRARLMVWRQWRTVLPLSSLTLRKTSKVLSTSWSSKASKKPPRPTSWRYPWISCRQSSQIDTKANKKTWPLSRMHF